jgi:hypothetical protein
VLGIRTIDARRAIGSRLTVNAILASRTVLARLPVRTIDAVFARLTVCTRRASGASYSSDKVKNLTDCHPLRNATVHSGQECRLCSYSSWQRTDFLVGHLAGFLAERITGFCQDQH